MKKIGGLLLGLMMLAGGITLAATNIFMCYDLPDRVPTDNYRTAEILADALDKAQSGNNPDMIISTKGLRELRCSGSASLSRSGMKTVIHDSAGYKLYIVDLRQEAHAYLNSAPITWYADGDWVNKGLSDNAIVKSDNSRIVQLAAESNVAIYSDNKQARLLYIDVISVTDEETFVRSFNVSYVRYFVADRMAPDNATIDKFVAFCAALPKNAWLHFHCRDGYGRTTTFMVMYDMLKNADRVSMADIVERQAAVAPNYNILSASDLTDKNGKESSFKERALMAQAFYDYCSARLTNGYQGTWSAWLKGNK